MTLHCRSIRLDKPFLVFAATDGCFGYVSTPMEFEGLLLQNLMAAESIAQWEERLYQSIGQVAGDDYSLCMGAYGDWDLPRLKLALAGRYVTLRDTYLTKLTGLPVENRQARMELWQSYKDNYFRFTKGGQD